MKKIMILAAVSAIGTSASAQVTTDLTQEATVQAVGTYTYFARGFADSNSQSDIGSVTPFTQEFYPGGLDNNGTSSRGLHSNDIRGAISRDGSLEDNGSNGAAISFSSGELTDTVAGGSPAVSGFIGVLSPDTVTGSGSSTKVAGQFDILFDLGAVYNVSEVIVTASDVSGFRWGAAGLAADAQEVLIASSFADPGQPADSDFTMFAKNTFVTNTTDDYSFDGSDALARYVLLRLTAETSAQPSSNTGSTGGNLREVTINGFVPEPGSISLVALGSMLVLCRRKKSA